MAKKAADLIAFPISADAHAQAETERKQKLFSWADAILQQLGFAARVAQAQSVSDVRKIVLDVENVDVAVAVNEALHPAVGPRATHFAGLRTETLRRLLKARLADMKRNREAELLGRGGRAHAYSWQSELKFDALGGIRPLLHNYILILRKHPEWRGVLSYNEFAARVIIRGKPYWGHVDRDTPWNDHFDSLTRTWFQRQDIAAGQNDCGRAVQAAARANSFHPVRQYLEGLKWDGVPRLDTWLQVYMHVEDTPYVRAIGPRHLIGGVARIYQPGCKNDHTLVLEGPQGWRKSEVFRVMAVKPAWFTDRVSPMASKDAAVEMAGVWIIELSELDALLRATASGAKTFLTRQSDRFRPPYGRHLVDHPRQCIFGGTINPPAGGYLKDSTGSRRIWPATCGGIVDVDALTRDRDQLWAEAVVRFKTDEPWWLETVKLEALAANEQKKRYQADTWQQPIEQWLGRRKDTSIAEVLRGVFGIAVKEQSQTMQTRVAHILTGLGFTKYRPGAGERKNRYYRV
jgi:predicted P-loop ATPase